MVFGLVFPVLADIISLFIVYYTRTGVDKARNNNIIKFLNEIYIELKQ